MPKLKILIIGSGGREHALAWKINQSKLVGEIFVAPGNPGTAEFCQNISINIKEIKKLSRFARDKKIDLTVVGPEIPLALGIVDEFSKKGLKIFGPGKKAAQLESSKVFSKQFMKKFNIPSADFEIFNDFLAAKKFTETAKYPLVIKADGLAAGKGVMVCQDKKQGHTALVRIMKNKEFGSAGERVIIEECLKGQEASIICLTDGESAYVLPVALDHKRLKDNDLGPNTGGMGAIAPNLKVPVKEILKKIIGPTLMGLKKMRLPYSGVLYAGIMLTEKGPQVLEYNCRFGDPETQVQLMLLKTDLVKLMLSCCQKKLKKQKISYYKEFAACVVCVSSGYPGKYPIGRKIKLPPAKHAIIFQAGTAFLNNKLVTAGGRVLAVTARDKNLHQALKKTYNICQQIEFKGSFFRQDIGKKL